MYKELLEIAKVHHSSRNNLQPLAKLSAKVIVKYEDFCSSLLMSHGFQVLLHSKTKSYLRGFSLHILDALNCQQRRTSTVSIGQLRVNLVMLLLTEDVKHFDFGVCGAFTAETNLEIWKCLAQKTPYLEKVVDMRFVYENGPSDAITCIPFILQLTKLQELVLKTYYFSNSALQLLVENHTINFSLKRMDIFLDNASLPEIDVLANFVNLQEFRFDVGINCKLSKIEIVPYLAELMPWLTLVGNAADELVFPPNYVYHNINLYISRVSLALKHICVFPCEEIPSPVTMNKRLPEVQHMMLTRYLADTEDEQDFFKEFADNFPNLITLNLRNFDFYLKTLEFLKMVGTCLNTLVLAFDSPKAMVDVGCILCFCPNLTKLCISGGKQTSSKNMCFPIIHEYLKLKQICLDNIMLDLGVFPALLRAPYLEEAAIKVKVTVGEYEVAARDVAIGRSLQSLKKLEFALPADWSHAEVEYNRKFLKTTQYMLANIITFAPKLESVKIADLDQFSKLKKFHNLVNQ